MAIRLRPLPSFRRSDRRAERPTLMAALIAVAVIAISVGFDLQHVANYREDLRERAERTGAALVRRIAARIDTLYITGESLRHAVTTTGEYSSRQFERTVRSTMADLPSLAFVVIAPTGGPLRVVGSEETGAAQGRGKDGGLDLAQLGADLQVSETRARPTLYPGSQDGYLTLIVPVLVDQPGKSADWGSIALLFDKKTFLESPRNSTSADASAGWTGLPASSTTWLDIGLFDAARSGQLAFLGDDGVRDAHPLTWSISIKDANWLVMTAPKAGWQSMPPDQLRTWIMLLLAALAVIVPVFVATSLIAERNRNIAALRLREARLLELSQRFHMAMDASNMGIWQMTEDGKHLYWDERAAALHGKHPDGVTSRLADWLNAILPVDKGPAEAHVFTCTCTDRSSTETYRVQLDSGEIRHLRSAGAKFSGDHGEARVTGIVWDVTADVLMNQALRNAKEDGDIKNAELELALDELSNREQELEQLSHKLDLALASSGCGIWEFDPATGLETWDARMWHLYGAEPGGTTLSQDQWFSMILPEDREIARIACMSYLAGNFEEQLVLRVPQADGSLRYIRSVGQLQTARDGSRKLIGLAFDVTQDALRTAELKSAKAESDAKNRELELAKSRIEHNSLHDPLTLLGNRRKLDVELERLSHAGLGERQKLAILHLDLDRFKQINDTLGHAAGDAMLVHASKILMRNVRRDDIVARIGGDEFVILSLGGSTTEELAQLSQHIVAEFRQPVDFEGFSCRCGVSIGIAQAGGSRTDARQILVNADLALYRAKAQGRNRYEFFTQNLQAEIISHKRTADELLAAIDNDEFVTWYQPQFNARTGKLSGAEALIRWNHPVHGVLAPDRFLRIAEDLNVMAVLDQFVLETVLKDKMRWKAMGVDVPKVSVNVSSKRLHDRGLIDTLATLAISPGEISFELVESIFLDDSDDVASGNLDRIKSLGIDLEIDDFGTGHTSIVSLLKLKPQRLKIDRQLVMPILDAPQERALVRSIIDIARSLGVDTVAEGVETMQHAMLLRDLGCDLLQGYAFARPLPFDVFTGTARAGWAQIAA